LVASLFGNIKNLPYFFISFGFLLSLVFKEVYRKKDYLFYENNGIPKIKLFVFAFFFNLTLSLLVFLFYKLAVNLF
jgi:hypothetical protein